MQGQKFVKRASARCRITKDLIYMTRKITKEVKCYIITTYKRRAWDSGSRNRLVGRAASKHVDVAERPVSFAFSMFQLCVADGLDGLRAAEMQQPPPGQQRLSLRGRGRHVPETTLLMVAAQ